MPALCDAAFAAATYSRTPSADFQAGPPASGLSATEFQFSGGIAIGLMDGVTIGAGLDYQYNHFEYDGIAGRDRDLHRLQFPFSWQHSGAGLQLRAFVAPGIATSSNVIKDPFDELTGDDLYATAGLQSAWVLGAGTAGVLGLAWDRAFGEPRLYPVAALEYAPGDWLSLRLGFPDPAIRLVPGERHAVAIRVFPAGQQWHVVSDEIQDDFDYRMEAWRSQLTWSYRPRRHLIIDASVGVEFARHHEFTDDQRNRVSTNADSQIYLVIGLRTGRSPLPYANGSHLPGQPAPLPVEAGRGVPEDACAAGHVAAE